MYEPSNLLRQAMIAGLALDLYQDSPFWVGGSDSQYEGQWRWESGARFDYFDWGSGQPNGGYDGNCLMLDHYEHFKWNDVSCRANVAKPLCHVRHN